MRQIFSIQFQLVNFGFTHLLEARFVCNEPSMNLQELFSQFQEICRLKHLVSLSITFLPVGSQNYIPYIFVYASNRSLTYSFYFVFIQYNCVDLLQPSPISVVITFEELGKDLSLQHNGAVNEHVFTILDPIVFVQLFPLQFPDLLFLLFYFLSVELNDFIFTLAINICSVTSSIRCPHFRDSLLRFIWIDFKDFTKKF